MENQPTDAQVYANKIDDNLLKSCWVDKKRGYVWVYIKGFCYGKKLHRVIMERKLKRVLLLHEQIDHKNGNKLDNRRSNLRLCSKSQNMMNQKRIDKGIRKTKENKWQARISKNRKQFCLGTFKIKQEAINAYNRASKELHGRFGQQNG